MTFWHGNERWSHQGSVLPLPSRGEWAERFSRSPKTFEQCSFVRNFRRYFSYAWFFNKIVSERFAQTNEKHCFRDCRPTLSKGRRGLNARWLNPLLRRFWIQSFLHNTWHVFLEIFQEIIIAFSERIFLPGFKYQPVMTNSSDFSTWIALQNERNL